MKRLPNNPLLAPHDLAATSDELEVLCTLNPAAVQVEKEIILLVRVGEKARHVDEGCVAVVVYDVEQKRTRIVQIRRDDPDFKAVDVRVMLYRGKYLLSSMSHLRLARSTDGGKTFAFDPQPAIYPSEPYETYGCEDARITFINGQYYITYTAVSNNGVSVAMAYTEDFVTFTKAGIIFPPFQKDVCIFPQKVRGMYVARHRPWRSEFNDPSIWTAYSPDLYSWGRHELTLAPTPGTWEADRVGAGAPPIMTPHGWLEIYHACDAHGRYALGAMLSDLDHPEKIISRSSKPVLEPEAPYETTGFYADCVFSGGLIEGPGGPGDLDRKLTIYYGAADAICAAAVTTVGEMVQAARS